MTSRASVAGPSQERQAVQRDGQSLAVPPLWNPDGIDSLIIPWPDPLNAFFLADWGLTWS